MKKVLVIGASGFLGKEIYNKFKMDDYYKTFGTYASNSKLGLECLDMTKRESAKRIFEKIKPDIVIIVAAITNVEYCENNKEEAYKINVMGLENIVKLCKNYRSKAIYISTEYVFDGNNGPYDEDDKENPINHYGWTKLEGERIIKEVLDEYLILRTTVVYGWDLESKNFIMQFIKNLDKNNSMTVPSDQISSPTYCPNLASMIKESCDKEITGIYNMVGKDTVDRYEFALKAAEILNLNSKLVIPVETKDLGQTARRPLKAGLKTEKISFLIDTKPIDIIEGLEEVKKLCEEHINSGGAL